jgi:hypothetical protein
MALLLCVAALAGCTQQASQERNEPPGPVIEGWVTNVALVPIAGAAVLVAGSELNTTTTQEGHFRLSVSRGTSVVVTVTARGYLPASQAIGDGAGAHHVLNFTLQKIPAAAPYDLVEKQEGFLQCAVTAVVLEDQGNPHSHQNVNCSMAVNDTRNIWRNSLATNASGLVFELEWEPNSELAQGLVMKITVDGSDDILGFIEGRSILKIHVSKDKLQEHLAAGRTNYTVTITPGAGTGEHEHGAIGVFVEQAFTIYATSFFNGPVDPTYTIADRKPK